MNFWCLKSQDMWLSWWIPLLLHGMEQFLRTNKTRIILLALGFTWTFFLLYLFLDSIKAWRIWLFDIFLSRIFSFLSFHLWLISLFLISLNDLFYSWCESVKVQFLFIISPYFKISTRRLYWESGDLGFHTPLLRKCPLLITLISSCNWFRVDYFDA